MLYAVWLEGLVLLFGQIMLNAKARSKNEGVSEGDLVCCCGLARQDCPFGSLDSFFFEKKMSRQSPLHECKLVCGLLPRACSVAENEQDSLCSTKHGHEVWSF